MSFLSILLAVILIEVILGLAFGLWLGYLAIRGPRQRELAPQTKAQKPSLGKG